MWYCFLIIGWILQVNLNMYFHILPVHILCIPLYLLFWVKYILVFGVKYSVLVVMHALTLVEHTFFLFFLVCPFFVIIDYGKYLSTTSAVNPICVGKWPFLWVLFMRVYLYITYIGANYVSSLPWG